MGTLCVDGRKKGVAPVIRIPWNDPAYIKKAYDVAIKEKYNFNSYGDAMLIL